MSLESATVHSVNVVYAQLMRDLGPAQVAATAHLLGIRSKLPLHCSMVLGADEVTPLELTSAYATIAGRRRLPPPARDPPRRGRHHGQDRGEQRPSACRPSASSARASRMRRRRSWSRSCSPAPGTRARLDDGRPQAGKTGTAENYGNAWFCGYTPDIASCVWVGYRSSNKPLENIEGFGAVYGGTIPAQIWKDFMTTATRRLPPHDWPEPKQPMVYRDFKATTSFGYNPAPPAAPDAAAASEAQAEAPSRRAAPTQVVIAPQNG